MSKRKKRLLSQPPISATIESLTHDGRGVTHIDGKTVFIRNALPGETVRFKYTNCRSKFDEGEAIEILLPASNRTEPKCPHYHLCGGCQLQHMAHEYQLEHKQMVLKNHFKHFGNIDIDTLLPVITGPIWHYRKKARLGVRFLRKKETVLVGFRERNGRYITDMNQCFILHQSIGEKIKALRELILTLENNETIPQIEVAIGDEESAIIIRHLEPLSENDLEKLCNFSTTHQLSIYLQPGKMDTIYKLAPGNDYQTLRYQLSNHNIEIHFHPSDFMQINSQVNQQMVKYMIQFLNPNKNDLILDLFCGLGNFTLPLAKLCKTVVGVEGNEIMVTRAKQNAQHNQIENAEFFTADLTKDITENSWAKQNFTGLTRKDEMRGENERKTGIYSEINEDFERVFNKADHFSRKSNFNKILLDPPRTGAFEMIETIASMHPEKILYISCNSATLARDAGKLQAFGFVIEKIGILDMFPHTSHFETICLFKNK